MHNRKTDRRRIRRSSVLKRRIRVHTIGRKAGEQLTRVERLASYHVTKARVRLALADLRRGE